MDERSTGQAPFERVPFRNTSTLQAPRSPDLGGDKVPGEPARSREPPPGPAHARQAEPSRASFLAQRRFGSLNGLRCLAILSVIWYHTSGQRSDLLGRGLGVDLSFAISGFLITTLLVREFSSTRKIDVRRFYARRTLRIFPLYFAVLGLYILLVIATRSGSPDGVAFMHNVPAFATYTSNWFVPLAGGHSTIFFFAWSLATQEQFYLLWPLALLLCLAPGRWWRAGAVMLAAIAAGEIARHAIADHDFPLTVVRSIAAPICLGAIWALLLHSPAGFGAARRLLGHRGAAPALLAVLALGIGLRAPIGILIFALAALVAACCIREDNLAAPLLMLRPVVFIGDQLRHVPAPHARDHVHPTPRRGTFRRAGVRSRDRCDNRDGLRELSLVREADPAPARPVPASGDADGCPGQAHRHRPGGLGAYSRLIETGNRRNG